MAAAAVRSCDRHMGSGTASEEAAAAAHSHKGHYTHEPSTKMECSVDCVAK